MGRLNFNGSWSAAVNDLNQYLGIDLGEDFTVTGIATQGSSDNATWVTKYTLQYGTASDHPKNYTEIMQGQEQMKVNSLNSYLSIIYVKKQKWYFILLLSIFIGNLTCKAWHTTSVNDMINTHVLCSCLNVFVLSFKCWAQNWTNWAKKRPLLNSIGRKEGKNRGKVTQVKCLAIWLWPSTVY